MSGHAASRVLCGALAALAALTSTGAAAQSVRISGLSDVQFGTLTNLINDQRASQTICVYSSALNGGYRVTATGSGPGGAARAPPARAAQISTTAVRASGGRVGVSFFMMGLRQGMWAGLRNQHSPAWRVRGWCAAAMR